MTLRHAELVSASIYETPKLTFVAGACKCGVVFGMTPDSKLIGYFHFYFIKSAIVTLSR